MKGLTALALLRSPQPFHSSFLTEGAEGAEGSLPRSLQFLRHIIPQLLHLERLWAGEREHKIKMKSEYLKPGLTLQFQNLEL